MPTFEEKLEFIRAISPEFRAAHDAYEIRQGQLMVDVLKEMAAAR